MPNNAASVFRCAFIASLAFAALTLSAVPTRAAESAPADDVAAKDKQSSDQDQSRSKPAALEEIVVTANKREEKLRDVPIAITAATAEQLQSSGIDDAADLSTLVPGMYMNNSIVGLQPHLRGVGTTNEGAGADNSIATYIDGVYISSIAGSLLNLSNIQQIEVDKGPQGTMFGRNATGGVIDIKTKDPSQTFGGKASVSYGNYNTVETNDYVTGGLAADLAADLAIHYTNQGDGFGRNIYNGSDVGKNSEFAGRSKWVFTPTENDKLTVAIDYEHTDDPALGAYHELYGTATQWGPGLPLPTGQPYVFDGKPWDIASIVAPIFDFEQGGVSGNYQHDFGFARLTNITAYRRARTHYLFSANPAPSSATIADERENETQFTEELQLASEDSSTIKWIAGIFYLNATAAYVPFTITGDVTAPAPVENVIWNPAQSTYSEAVFGQTTIPVPVISNTNVTIGLRYTNEERTLHSGGQTINFTPASNIPPIVALYDDRATFDKLTYRFAIDHHFTDDLMAYVSSNRGFISGVYNTQPPTATPVKPEVLDAQEAGIKTEFLDHRLGLNVSAFYDKYSDIQVAVSEANSTVLVNGARADIYGIDLDLTARVTDNLTVMGGFEYLHDRFLSFPGAKFVTPLPASQGGGGSVVVGDAAGNRLPFAPDYAFNLSANYTAPITYGTLDFNVTYSYSGRWFAAPDNIVEAPASNLINMQSGLTLLDRRTRVSLWVRNLKNQAVPMTLNVNGNPGGNFQEIDAPPRTFGVTVQYTF